MTPTVSDAAAPRHLRAQPVVRVLSVLYELRPSGAEMTLRSVAPLWEDLGVEMDLLAIGPTRGSYWDALAAAGYRLEHLPVDPHRHFLLRYPRLLRRRRYDVVHVHPERANFPAAVGALLTGSRVVRTHHSLRDFAGALRWERVVQRRALHLLGVRNVAVGPAVAASERELFGNPSVVIPNCYDVHRFRPPDEGERASQRRRWDVPDDVHVVVSVGNCSPLKNHEAFFEALAAVGAAGVLYLHAGEEQAGCPERALAERLGLSDRVRFLGRVDDVPSLLQAADSYVMPSRFEGFSIAALEALGSGLPALLSDVPGLRDLHDAGPGLVWAPPTPDGLRRGLEEMLALDPAERRRLGAALHAHVSSRYSPRAFAERYAEVYRALRA